MNFVYVCFSSYYYYYYSSQRNIKIVNYSKINENTLFDININKNFSEFRGKNINVYTRYFVIYALD